MSGLTVVELAFAAVAGLLLGLAFFGSLWLTLLKIGEAERPLRRLLLSTVVRLAVLLPAIYLVIDGRWERLLACLAGLMIARLILIRRLRPGTAARALQAAKTEN